MTQLVEITKSDLELIESLEFDENADKHCESNGHSEHRFGHSDSSPLWYAKFGCECFQGNGVMMICETGIDTAHPLLVQNSYICPFSQLANNLHFTDVIKIEPVK